MDKNDAKALLKKNKNGLKEICMKFCNNKIPRKITKEVDAVNEVIIDFFREFDST